MGRALAEIHAVTYPETGVLDGDLSIAKPFPPDGWTDLHRGAGSARAGLDEAEPFLDAALAARVRVFLDEIAEDADVAPSTSYWCSGSIAGAARRSSEDTGNLAW